MALSSPPSKFATERNFQLSDSTLGEMLKLSQWGGSLDMDPSMMSPSRSLSPQNKQYDEANMSFMTQMSVS